MSACAMLSYNNINSAAWTSIKTAAAPYGLNGNDSGSATVDGFTIAWSYVKASETLHIQCADSPFYVSCSIINGKINEEIERCINAHGIQMVHMVPA